MGPNECPILEPHCKALPEALPFCNNWRISFNRKPHKVYSFNFPAPCYTKANPNDDNNDKRVVHNIQEGMFICTKQTKGKKLTGQGLTRYLAQYKQECMPWHLHPGVITISVRTIARRVPCVPLGCKRRTCFVMSIRMLLGENNKVIDSKKLPVLFIFFATHAIFSHSI